jgi:hypothetical protein
MPHFCITKQGCGDCCSGNVDCGKCGPFGVVAFCMFAVLHGGARSSQCSSMSDGENYECYGEGVELELENTSVNTG